MRLTICRLLTAAVFASSPALAHAAAPAPAAPAKNTSSMDTARKALEEVGDMNYQGKSLNDLISDLKDKSKISVVIDPMVFQFGFDPNQPTVNVNLKQVKLKEGLSQALAPFNLKCGLTREGLYISTEEGVTAKQLRQRVSVDCDGTPFDTAAKQLAADTGANLVIDPRLAEKAKKAVTLKLDDVPLETAVRLMAEVADLGTVRMSNVLFVTTPERAEKLRPSADGPTQPNNSGVIPFPIGGGGWDRPIPFPVPIGPDGGGVAPGFPGQAVPGGVEILPAMPVEAKPQPAPNPPRAPETGTTPAPATTPPAPPPPGGTTSSPGGR